MKTTLIIISCVLTFTSFGQEWKDTLNEARRLYKKGNYKEALKYYKRAERLAPNDVDLSQEIGQTAYRANDFGTAAENFERQANNAQNKEKEISARTSLGESRMKQQDFQAAIDAYKDVLRLDQDNEKARQRLVEAKRLLEQQKKEQQNKEDKANKEQNKDNQNQQQNNNQQNQNQNQQNSKDKQQNQNQQNQQSQQQKSEQKKLQDKETERKLDEFSKQELNTKKRLDGSKGTTGGKRARKDW
ncbi:MAG: Tetratricopeptide 1 repeat-containing protein [Fluviicola sp.]|jgi:Ca-activated chloride channel family protein|uniref:tetratricopeptide repeat protein n=1 Tax=Fluviicola sp. TaxID=1917219 RepID=UPI0026189417|nr:tetratricopeptide repeat protein [Fluviicola sp.]MDF3027884.1 Tetratricopeptide 1 repeat-containing protein [Fluviicola sp.]